MEKKHALMQIEDARALIRKNLSPRPAVSRCLAECMGRVTARPLSAAFDESAMDGYALTSTALGPHPLLEDGFSSAISQIAVLGACRVATGFPVPDWAVCVVPQEN